jgi:hypothetical protein
MVTYHVRPSEFVVGISTSHVSWSVQEDSNQLIKEFSHIFLYNLARREQEDQWTADAGNNGRLTRYSVKIRMFVKSDETDDRQVIGSVY